MKTGKNRDMDEFRRLLAKTSPGDFDGHTDFDKLTPEQRLMWLSQCAQFVTGARKGKTSG
ncbi:MAG TPA: hypothetical protein PK307_13885 [Spirochaetota bacterium]|nr:hypothetical protein [Spirochaetota bacterium]HOD16919.1 hypothetical protein [Spirochaetota bacterium]HPN11088.1 hypothetical protein [Spirochaetota bacterium]HQL83290.1 hypothetical protein [Spirochaetota bacterium]